jgi:rod shape-determining protein MreC
MFILPNRYRNITFFVCFCILSLILSWLTVGAARTASSDSDSLKYKVSPLLIPFYACSSAISSIWSQVVRVGSVFASAWQKPVEKTQLQELEQQVEHLERQLETERDANRKKLEDLHEVYASLAEGTAESNPAYKLTPAKVIAVEPTDWFRYLTIDKGNSDGVRVDMAVITRSEPAGDVSHITSAVVGKVVQIQSHSARVQLITDRISVVAVTIGSQGDLVLLRGQPETENCAIDAIPSTTHDMLKEGHAVVVDERSSIFPPGMLVGTISSIEKGTHFCRVEVQPSFKFSKLRDVMVVLDTGQ